MRSSIIPALLLASALGANIPAAFAQDAKPYTMHADRPATGSNIPERVVSSPIPLDLTYAEFSPEQRAKLHALYPNLKPGDEPPFPLHGLKPVMRHIAEVQRRALHEGEAVFGVRVDANGKAQSIRIYKSPGDELSRVIGYFLINTDYKPAMCDGQPCEGEYCFNFGFHVNDASPLFVRK